MRQENLGCANPSEAIKPPVPSRLLAGYLSILRMNRESVKPLTRKVHPRRRRGLAGSPSRPKAYVTSVESDGS